MAWRALVEDDILLLISGSELASLRAAALQAEQVDPVQPTIDATMDLARGYIGSCSENTLGDAGTIPDRLITTVAMIVVCDIVVRVPGYFLDEDRQDKRDAAIKVLEQVAGCNFAIEDPTTGTDAGNDVEVVRSTTRKATRESMGGL